MPRIIKQKHPMERLNTPFVFLAVFIPFIALCVHAYPKEVEQPYTDADKAAMQRLINSLVEGSQEAMLTDDIGAYVYLYNDSGEI